MSTETQMRVRVLQLGRRVLEHVGASGQPLSSVLEAVGLPVAEGMDLRVNGAPAKPTQPLKDRDVVTIIPRIKGGAWSRDRHRDASR